MPEFIHQARAQHLGARHSAPFLQAPISSPSPPSSSPSTVCVFASTPALERLAPQAACSELCSARGRGGLHGLPFAWRCGWGLQPACASQAGCSWFHLAMILHKLLSTKILIHFSLFFFFSSFQNWVNSLALSKSDYEFFSFFSPTYHYKFVDFDMFGMSQPTSYF